MDRADVYILIDGERNYQDSCSESEERLDMLEKMSMGEALLAMDKLLDDAKDTWYKDSAEWNYSSTMHYIRKVIALGVKMGETYGMPPRYGYDGRD
jgi:hypothetical protein